MDAPNATVAWTVRLVLILEQNSLKFAVVNYILIHLFSSGENFFSRYISTWIYKNGVSKHFVIFLNFPSLSLFTVLFAYVASFLGLFRGQYPGCQRFFSRVRRGALFRRPQAGTCSAEKTWPKPETAREKPLAPRARG